MTKEEYMAIRNRICETYAQNNDGDCTNCPLKTMQCHPDILETTYTSFKTMEMWAEKHPVKTNREKFKEVFGIPTLRNGSSWWDEEYQKPKGEE